MFQCFSRLYSAPFDKSSQKERKKPNIIPRPACSYLAAGKNILACVLVLTFGHSGTKSETDLSSSTLPSSISFPRAAIVIDLEIDAILITVFGVAPT